MASVFAASLTSAALFRPSRGYELEEHMTSHCRAFLSIPLGQLLSEADML